MRGREEVAVRVQGRGRVEARGVPRGQGRGEVGIADGDGDGRVNVLALALGHGELRPTTQGRAPLYFAQSERETGLAEGSNEDETAPSDRRRASSGRERVGIGWKETG